MPQNLARIEYSESSILPQERMARMCVELKKISWPDNADVTICQFCGVSYDTPRPIDPDDWGVYTELFAATECGHECCDACVVMHVDDYAICPVCAAVDAAVNVA